MTINDIITKHYNRLYNSVVKHNKVISQGRTPEDLLNDVCLTALRKFKQDDITEEDGLSYLKKTLFTESKFQYNRIKNELVIFSDTIPDICYIHSFDI